jgi:hypothetical protein
MRSSKKLNDDLYSTSKSRQSGNILVMIDHSSHFFQRITNKIKKDKGLALFILLVAFVGFFNSFRFGTASVQHELVKHSIDAWQSHALVQTEKTFTHAKSAIEIAGFLHTSNPEYMNLTGHIKEWGAVSGYDDANGLAQAKLDYLNAIKVRPLWPMTWANLAMVKWRLQEFDEEMQGFLNKANELGPQSVAVHVLFTRLGITLHKAEHPMFSSIGEVMRERIRLGLRNKRSKEMILSLIESTDSLEEVCRWMALKDPITADLHLNCT